MDTDMTNGFEMQKTNPQQVAAAALIGIEANKEEVLVNDFTKAVKRSLSDEAAVYLNPPEIA